MKDIRVMVVEDESAQAEEMKSILNTLGYTNCTFARDSAEAINMARGLCPDIILMDTHLNSPNDGIDTAGHIRSEMDVPVVYLSDDYSDDDTFHRMKKTLPCGCLTKPLKHHELRSTIELALNQHQTYRQLSQHSDWLNTALHSSRDGMIIFDSQIRIQLMNPVALKLLGLQNGYYKDTLLPDQLNLFNDITGDNFLPAIQNALLNCKIINLGDNVLLQRNDGKTIAVSASVSPILSQQKTCIGAILCLHDLSQQRQTEQNLLKSRQEIEMKNQHLLDAVDKTRKLAIQANIANQFKTSFMADINQEIRHPLNTIAGFSSLLQEEIGENRFCDYLQIINQSCRELMTLLDNFSDYSKLENDHCDITISDTSLQDLITAVDLSCRSQATRKGLQLTIDQHDPLPDIIQTDPVRLKQCLLNLIDNAVKFTHEGYIRISIRQDAAPLNPHLHFVIEDSGIGIPAEHQALLISQMSQDKLPLISDFHSHGLGLIVTSHLLRLINGRIKLESFPGKGTAFTLSIPVCCPHTAQTPS